MGNRPTVPNPWRPIQILEFTTLYGQKMLGFTAPHGKGGPAIALADLCLGRRRRRESASVADGVSGTSMPHLRQSAGEVARHTNRREQWEIRRREGQGRNPNRNQSPSYAAKQQRRSARRSSVQVYGESCHGQGRGGSKATAPPDDLSRVR